MSYNFNGSSNYLSGTGFTGLNGSSQASISFWMWKTTIGTSDGLDFGAFSSSGILFWYNANASPSSESNCFSFSVGSTSSTNRVNSTTNSGNAVDGKWAHIVGTMNGSDRSLYINGVLNATSSGGASTVPSFSGGDFRIGSWSGSGNFAGENDRLADIGAWNRELSAAEVYGLSRGLTCDHIPRSLVLYFPLLRNFSNIRSSQTVSENGTVSVFDPHPNIQSFGRV